MRFQIKENSYRACPNRLFLLCIIFVITVVGTLYLSLINDNNIEYYVKPTIFTPCLSVNINCIKYLWVKHGCSQTTDTYNQLLLENANHNQISYWLKLTKKELENDIQTFRAKADYDLYFSNICLGNVV